MPIKLAKIKDLLSNTAGRNVKQSTILENKQFLINIILTYDLTILNANYILVNKCHLRYLSRETKTFFHTETCI